MVNMKKFLLFLSLFTVFIGALAPTATVNAGATPPPAPAAAGNCNSRWFLGLKPWWVGLTVSATDCSIDGGKIQGREDGLAWFIGVLALNILENVFIIIGYIAVGFIIYGGFRYITAQGSPDGIAKAKKTIQNAVIGLAIGISATVIVNVVFNVLGLGL